MDQNVHYDRLLKETKKQQEHLQILYRGAKEILKLRSFEKTAKKLFSYCKKITGATSGYVALLSDDGKENKVLYLDAGGKDCNVDPYLPMPIRGLREKAYRSKKTVYHNDFMNTDWVKFMPDGHTPLKNVLFAPLIIEDNVVGLIGLGNKPDGFNQYDANIAGAFGNLAASALQNSWLFKEIQKQNAGKEKLISIISHDVRNFLNSIHGFSNLLLESVESKNDEKIFRFANIINNSSNDAILLLEDLMTWLNTNSGKLPYNPKKFDVNKLIKDLADTYMHIAAEKKIQLSTDIITKPFYTLADEKMISTVLRNLIANATKFTKPNGKIKVAAKSSNSMVEVSVSDTGVGMSKKQLNDLFNPEKENYSLGTGGEKGLGIGFLLCKELIYKHGQEIKVVSDIGRGSTFSFSLPIAN